MPTDSWSSYEDFKTARPLATTYYGLVRGAFEAGVRRICNGKRVGKAVDLGCGNGDFARGLRAVAENVVGFDQSHGLIKEALSHPDQDGVAFIQGNVLDEAAMAVLRSGDFDLVTAAWLHNYMHSEKDQHQLLREILRMLGAGGCIVFLIPGDAYTSVRTQRFAAELHWRQAWLKETPEYTRGVFSFEGSPWDEMTVWQPLWLAQLYRRHFSVEFLDVKSLWLDQGGLDGTVLEPPYDVMIGHRR
ncbi:MAG: class I SAM-dependent methyltransferase [Desulfomonile tiedjei]|nr:class I SAM-dependent methyltransferase [Desulfomonile tiedjei]